MGRADARKGPADFRPGRNGEKRIRLYAGTLESLRRGVGMARYADRDERRAPREDQESDDARSGEERTVDVRARQERPRHRWPSAQADRAVGREQAGVGEIRR